VRRSFRNTPLPTMFYRVEKAVKPHKRVRLATRRWLLDHGSTWTLSDYGRVADNPGVGPSMTTSALLNRVTIVSVGDHSKEGSTTHTAAVLENLHRIARVLTP
jgi:hypothetical protein